MNYSLSYNSQIIYYRTIHKLFSIEKFMNYSLRARFAYSVASPHVAPTQQTIGGCCVLYSALRASRRTKILNILE